MKNLKNDPKIKKALEIFKKQLKESTPPAGLRKKPRQRIM